jgi:hypothetical protein
VKTQLQYLIPNIAKNLTFNSLSGPGSFKTPFNGRTPYEETGSWKSKLYKGTNLVYSNNLKGIYNRFNEEIERHNQNGISEALENNKAILDDQLIVCLKEEHIKWSYYTHVNSKGTLLAYLEKGHFAYRPQMNLSKNMKNVTKVAEKR